MVDKCPPHDWHRPLKENGRRSTWRKCWKCGKRKRISQQNK